MKPTDFGVRNKAKQNGRALFLVDELDAGGTEALFSAGLWDDEPGTSPAGADPLSRYPRRAVEPDGTVHAARYAENRQHFTTKCAVYPAPTVDRLEHSSDRKVTCPDCTQ